MKHINGQYECCRAPKPSLHEWIQLLWSVYSDLSSSEYRTRSTLPRVDVPEYALVVACMHAGGRSFAIVSCSHVSGRCATSAYAPTRRRMSRTYTPRTISSACSPSDQAGRKRHRVHRDWIAPGPAVVWQRMGSIYEQGSHYYYVDDGRAAWPPLLTRVCAG